ncbi:MAG: DUF4175 domain-containing protein [Archangium sp.]|nr:DUF4175 domain-containing protein [Archangium sp.]MDP3153505.1 DUF4175 domain-containing protein [Archangium sp.]MDP3574741.1 DUF4175 domain-containing protein [Archangium sp.]
MYEPSSPLPPPEPPRPPTPTSSSEGRALRLLAEVRGAQARALQTQGVLLAVVTFLVLLVAGAWVGSSAPRAGLALIIGGAVAAVTVLVLFGIVLPRRRVGDNERTARMLAAQLPELNLDLLAAVELSKALGTREDFSPDLARAFLRDVDAKASRLSVDKLIDQKPTQRAAMTLVATVFVLLALLFVKGATLRAGLAMALMPAEAAEPLRRQPITGDVELTYRYPVHTGLDVRTIPSSTGDISAPAGTEVTVKTRADRDIEGAALVLTPGNQRVPLRLERRELTGSFVLNESGTWHVVFLEGDDVVAEGPDQSITVEVDQAPQARITSPLDGVELDPSKQTVTLKFDASDDYGLSALELVYTPAGGETKRISLKPDDGRTTRGNFQWDLAPLQLRPGQEVTYFLEATDNDAVKGPKKGASPAMRLKLYSSAEHRRQALAKAEELWGRLVDHLADRMEAPDRASPTPVDAAVAGKPIDERGVQLASDIAVLAQEIRDERDPSEELLSTLLNISAELNSDVSQVVSQRRVLLRIAGREGGVPGKNQFVDTRNGTFTQDIARRVATSIATDIQHSEKNVLYLEALLDRAKLDAIRDLANQLREDRKELSRLLEEFGRTKDPKLQEALVEQMQNLKQRMLELQQRMAELSKGIRDDFMNAEALQQMLEEDGLQSSLDEVEKLVKEGKAEEALKKMQELAMELDAMLEQLDEAGDRADDQSDPELARQYDEFQQNLEDTAKKQEQLADKTRALRDKYREQQKERIARQGEALKRELKEKLEELDKSWKQLEGDRFGFRFEDVQQEAMQARDNVQQSLEANDFDLASEAADRMEDKATQMAEAAAELRQRDELFNNPPEVRRESKQAADKVQRDAKKASEVAQKLRDLFPQAGQQMSEQDRQQMNELARGQKQLQQQAQQLQQQMDAIGERAPLFDEDAQQQMDQVGQRMQGAGEKLAGKDPSRGFGEQQGAMQGLRGIQQAMAEAAKGGKSGKGGKGGIPMPIKRRGGRSRGGQQNEKVEIVDEDPNAGTREFRKDVMDAMKQGAPDRYKDQNKKYYEELVK